MDGEQYLRQQVEQRLADIRGHGPDSTVLSFYELRGAAEALVAAELVDRWTANDILDEWTRTLEAEGILRREAVALGFHDRAQATTTAVDATLGRSDEPDRIIQADAIDAHIVDVDGIRLVADGLIRFTQGFELRVMFHEGSHTARTRLLERMTQHHWEWRIRDSHGAEFRETGGHGGLGGYTLRFRPALPDNPRELTLTIDEDSHTIAHVAFTIPTRVG